VSEPALLHIDSDLEKLRRYYGLYRLTLSALSDCLIFYRLNAQMIKNHQN